MKAKRQNKFTEKKHNTNESKYTQGGTHYLEKGDIQGKGKTESKTQ